MSTKVGIYVWLTLPPGMDPKQAVREVKTSIAFGQAEVKLQYIEEGAPDGCSCGEPGHDQCDDPRHHLTCGCVLV